VKRSCITAIMITFLLFNFAVTAFVSATVTISAQNVSDTCQSLKQSLGSEVIVQNETQYRSVASKNW
jgi:hypothetical protein